MIKIVINCEEMKKGIDWDYRDSARLTVEQDCDTPGQLSIKVDDRELFVKKEDLKSICRAFNII